MIGCRRVATLLSHDQLDAQPAWRRAIVRLHLSICAPCRAFRRQLGVIRQAASTVDEQYGAELGADFVNRLHDKLVR